MVGELREISYKTAKDFILPRHYAGRTPQITKAFGWYINEELVAVCTFGKPASRALCIGILGEQYADKVYELNRLCRVDGLKEQLSGFVSACLRALSKEDWIVVSYSDTGMNHHGYIYQASNFMYTGVTKERTDMYVEDGKHSRHYKEENQKGIRKVRTAKHRYVFFACSNKRIKKEYMRNLKYEILPYPKGR